MKGHDTHAWRYGHILNRFTLLSKLLEMVFIGLFVKIGDSDRHIQMKSGK